MSGHRDLETGKTTTPPAACICGKPFPEAPLTWGARRFCSMACFSAWYVVSGHDGGEGAPLAYRDYSEHVQDCPTCIRADREDQLCAEGGALFDALDNDPTDPGVAIV